MNALRTHAVLMLIYATALGLFFALLWKHERRERILMFLIIFCSLVFGGIALGWLMFPFPLR